MFKKSGQVRPMGELSWAKIAQFLFEPLLISQLKTLDHQVGLLDCAKIDTSNQTQIINCNGDLCNIIMWHKRLLINIITNASFYYFSTQPTVAAIEAGKDIALANKETMIAGGAFVLPLAHKHNIKILPADSEHSAIFQVSKSIGWKPWMNLLSASFLAAYNWSPTMKHRHKH